MTMYAPIISPIKQPLLFNAFPACEGLSETSDCDIYETKWTWEQLADHFDCEANSDLIPEEQKHQRDVDANDARVRAMRRYISDRPDTLFPSLTIFVNHVIVNQVINLAHSPVADLTLPAFSHRLICDGQGRTMCVKTLLATHPELSERSVGVKLIVTNTDSLHDARDVIRQVFSDINGQTKMPSASLSLYFDMAKPISRLTKSLLDDVKVNGVPLQSRIALNGQLKSGQLWTLKQFADLLPLLFAETASSLNEQLKDESIYRSIHSQCRQFLEQALAQLPLDSLSLPDMKHSEYLKVHKQAMFTKALFAKALGHLGRSLFEQHMADQSPVNWSLLEGLRALSLSEMDNKVWITNQICWRDDDVQGKPVKILKSSDKKIARVACHQCRIFPSLDI